MAKKKVDELENTNVEVTEETVTTSDDDKEEAKRKSREYMETHKRIRLITDVPYTLKPNKFEDVAGTLKAGKTFFVIDEITNETGEYWQVGYQQFVNKDWEVIVYNDHPSNQ